MDNNIQEQQAPSSDDRLLAMFSHFSIFLGGIILPIILYFVQKDKSKFVAFHSLQSIFFHLLYMVIIFFLVMILIFILLITGVFSHHHNYMQPSPSPLPFLFGLGIFYVGLLGSIFLAIGYGIYMGIKAYNGEMKKYIIVGDWAYRKVYGNK